MPNNKFYYPIWHIANASVVLSVCSTLSTCFTMQLRVFLPVVVLFAMACLAGCGNNSQTQGENGQNSQVTEQSGTNTVTETTTEGITNNTTSGTNSSNSSTTASGTNTSTPGNQGTTAADSAAQAAVEARYASQLPAVVVAIDLCRQRYFTQLPTFGAGLEDVNVMVRDIQPWASENLADYVGSYQSGLEASVGEIKFQIKNGRLIGTIDYQTEIVDSEGMLVPSRGTEAMVYSKLEGSILRWPRLRSVKHQVGQFVMWTSGGRAQRGILLYEDSQTPFTLLLKK